MPEASAKSKAVVTQEPQQSDKLEVQLLDQAKTPQERQLAFTLASQARQAKMIRDVAVAVAETGWGKGVSPISRAAVVRYCLEIGADPVRHVYLLGGNVYMNAAFWMDLVAANPKFQRAETEFIHEDARAGDEDNADRKAQRVTYGVPEGVKGAAVVTLHYADGRGPFIGVNWVGSRGKPDPVGEAEPTKTAETRAYRRAAMKAEPAWFGKHPHLKGAHELFATGREVEPSGPEEDETPVAEIAAGEKPATGVIEKHSPSAICPIDTEHPRSDCGYHKAKAQT